MQKYSFKNYSSKKQEKIGRLRNMQKRSPKDCSSKRKNIFFWGGGGGKPAKKKIQKSGYIFWKARQLFKSAASKIIE